MFTLRDGIISASVEYTIPKPRGGVGPKSGAASSESDGEGSRRDDGTLHLDCHSPVDLLPPAEESTASKSSKSLGFDSRSFPHAAKSRRFGVRKQPPRRSKSRDPGNSIDHRNTSSPTVRSPSVLFRTITSSQVAKENATKRSPPQGRTSQGTPRLKAKMAFECQDQKRSEGSGRGSSHEVFLTQREAATSPTVSASLHSTSRRPRGGKTSDVSVFSPRAEGHEFELEVENGEDTIEAPGRLKENASLGLDEESRVEAGHPRRRKYRFSGYERQAHSPRRVETPHSSGEEAAHIKRRRVATNVGTEVRGLDMMAPSILTSLPQAGVAGRFGAQGPSTLAFDDSDVEAEGENDCKHETGCWRLSDGDQTDVEEGYPRSKVGSSRAPDSRGARSRSRRAASNDTPREQRTSKSIHVASQERETEKSASAFDGSAGRRSISTPTSTRYTPPSRRRLSASIRSEDETTPNDKDLEILETLKAYFSKVDSHELHLSRF